MKLSIALCTFNGTPYLAAQLESIAAQTRPPDELIVSDDQSSDNSRKIVETFASAAKFPVRLYLNEKQLGVRKNFERAIGLCSGDLISLCDQDDIWQPEKLQLAEAVFRSSPSVGLVFSDAELVKDDLQAEDRSLWQAVGFDAKKQKQIAAGNSLEVLLGINVVTGATMTFRSDFRELILPIPPEGCLYHDGWIALIIAAVAELAFIDRRLIKYRQHAGQLVGAPPIRRSQDTSPIHKTESRHYSEQADRFEEAYERLVANRASVNSPVALSMLKEKIVHLRARAAMPDKRLSRVPLVARETVNRRYHQYSHGWFSAAKDLLV
ncbi:MAG TPA: glycosyltransferase family 2 protein [Pyrinomonadaceae bacterium]|jgi:glycosyltransferase involved in cell wall biosynthesis|nr:glycosyltransferase family 2 protein [Pyrinomonadaceae bacterium]